MVKEKIYGEAVGIQHCLGAPGKKDEICPLLQKDKIDILMKRYFIFKATGLKCIDRSMGSKTFKGKK